jgi:protein-S-isoprenylcysteine O-methyltransferase Ste14
VAQKTVLGFTQLIVVLGTLLFGTAWTFDYWQAWVYLFVFAASCALITAYLWKKDPELLARRVNAGPGAEKEKGQKRIQRYASLAFIGTLILRRLIIASRGRWSSFQ